LEWIEHWRESARIVRQLKYSYCFENFREVLKFHRNKI